MKKVLLALSLCFVVAFASAQSLEKGSSRVNVGLGLVDLGANASYDYGIVDTWGPGLFTVGAQVAFGTQSENILGHKFRENRIVIAPRATYRYPIADRFEIYGAFMMGVRIHSFSYKSGWVGTTKSNATDFTAGIAAGGRYAFTESLGAFAEIGWNDANVISLGVSFAF